MFRKKGIEVKLKGRYATVKVHGGRTEMMIGPGMALQNMVYELRETGLPEELVRKIVVRFAAQALEMEAPQGDEVDEKEQTQKSA